MQFPDDIYVAMISARRPDSVPVMEAKLGFAPTWYVAKGDAAAYKAKGATKVIESGPLTKSRNMALEDAFAMNRWCLQLSDDMMHCYTAISKKDKVKIGIANAVVDLRSEMIKSRAKLGGVAPTQNEFFFNPKKPVKTVGFIVGDFILVAPCALRFDEKMKLKEDYDFCINHLKRYGRVCRVDRLLIGFKHRDNKGGAVSYRTEAEEQKAIEYLKKKHKGFVRDNPRRENEILLTIK